MGTLVFQATLGGQINLTGTNTASTFTITVPALTGTMASLASVTNNGVAYVNSSGQPTSGSAFVFDGTNVGIGTSSPGVKLDVTGALRVGVASNPTTIASNSQFYDQSGIGPTISGYNFEVRTGNPTPSARMTVDSAGNVGIGTSSPSSYGKFSVYGASVNGTATFLHPGNTSYGTVVTLETYAGTDSPALSFKNYNSGSPVYYSISENSSGALLFNSSGSVSSAGTERMRIDASGNLLVGATSTSGNTGRIASKGNSSGFDTYQGYNNSGTFTFAVSAGGTVFAVSTTISSISDQRLKENIRDLNVGLDKIMALKPRLYDWKEGKGANIKNARGFIAQEFEEVFPDLIDEWREPAPEGEKPYKSVRQDLIPVLVRAIQEQQALIESLTTRLTALEQK
jgi:hypothetical protein